MIARWTDADMQAAEALTDADPRLAFVDQILSDLGYDAAPFTVEEWAQVSAAVRGCGIELAFVRWHATVAREVRLVARYTILHDYLEDSTMTDADDTERTDDAAFRGTAAERLGNATAEQTRRTADEEDGSSPDEPQPESYPDAADESPAGDDDQADAADADQAHATAEAPDPTTDAV